MRVETIQGSMDRRVFVFGSAAALAGSVMHPGRSASAPAGSVVLPRPSATPSDTSASRFIVGPIDGFSPQVGTLVSMMNFMRPTVVRAVEGLSQEELDHFFDSEANTIGALLLHLAATEVFYQVNTFEGREFNDREVKQWRVAQNLGAAAREEIKGHSLDYYLSILEEVHEKTLTEFRKRDDEWLAETEPFFSNQPTNNYCKWFHVVEHEAHHRGQIAWLAKRLPGHEFADVVRK